MLTAENLTFILSLLTLGGVVFAIYKSIHKPQEDLETNQALAKKDLDNKATILAQKELETKALVLAEQVKSKNEETERRFNEIGTRLEAVMTTAQNHIHTIDTKVDALVATVGVMGQDITRLTTVIEERIPRVK